ncbi:hypothetical protein L9F63_002230, partial [Diploptera punctata]
LLWIDIIILFIFERMVRITETNQHFRNRYDLFFICIFLALVLSSIPQSYQ